MWALKYHVQVDLVESKVKKITHNGPPFGVHTDLKHT